MLRRAVFSDVQRKALEKMFQKQKYISKPDRKKLAAKLGLKDSQVRGEGKAEGGRDHTHCPGEAWREQGMGTGREGMGETGWSRGEGDGSRAEGDGSRGEGKRR